ncbi:hypothetical protein SPJ2_1867 [Streptococcus parauberis KRS-02109]|nr:hypothetical protein SPJ2_1867 [Streptococcus parauberis KRS-02109]
MIKTFIGQNLIETLRTPEFLIFSTIDDLRNSRQTNSTTTHDTGFNGHKHGRLKQAPITFVSICLTNGHHFGMHNGLI